MMWNVSGLSQQPMFFEKPGIHNTWLSARSLEIPW